MQEVEDGLRHHRRTTEVVLDILGGVMLLEVGVSIPLMEKRQLANKPGYAEYRKQTRILI